jgi:predicted RNA-binding protein YlqC (UPF0109 family)
VTEDPNRIDDSDEYDEYDDEDDIDGNRIDDDDDYGDDDVTTVPAGTARAVLQYLVASVVDDPEAVAVEYDEGGRRPALNVTVGDGDMGRVIGKRGRVAQAIRTVTRAAASRDRIEIDIEFLD